MAHQVGRFENRLEVVILSREMHKQWMCSKGEIKEVYEMPFLDLVYHAASVHRLYHDPHQVSGVELVEWEGILCFRFRDVHC